MACPSACLGLSTLSVHNLEFVTFASGFSGLAGGASRVLCSVFANLPLNKSYQIYKYTGRHTHTCGGALFADTAKRQSRHLPGGEPASAGGCTHPPSKHH